MDPETPEKKNLDLSRISANRIHETVLEYLHAQPPGKLLDVPAGNGELAKILLEMGFQVSCCDIDDTLFIADSLPIDKGDLNGRLPYEDATFDYVSILEGIEHTENPYNAVREAARVLKGGGTLILTTPNYLSIGRRVKFFFTGCFTKPVSREMFRDKFGGIPFGMHLSPIGYTLIKFAMENAGLELVKVGCEKHKPWNLVLKPLVWFIRIYTRLWPASLRRKYWIGETASPPILDGGRTLVVVAKKKIYQKR